MDAVQSGVKAMLGHDALVLSVGHWCCPTGPPPIVLCSASPVHHRFWKMRGLGFDNTGMDRMGLSGESNGDETHN